MGPETKVFESNQQVPTIILYITNELIKSGEDSYNNLINLYKEHLKYGFDFPMEYYLSKDGSIKLEYE